MRRLLLDILACPACHSSLDPEGGNSSGDIHTGVLRCSSCLKSFPLINGIPRFVRYDENYCRNFGWQWTVFRRTQVDRFSGVEESRRRFYKETGWSPEELSGLLVLDAGCGAGRFTDVACQAGARVVAVDISEAVDACAETVKGQGYDVDIVQASLLELPFKTGVFDRIFCIGVVQHTPDPEAVVRSLPKYLVRGGVIAYWMYEARWIRFVRLRNYLRIVTKRLPARLTYFLSLALVLVFFPITLLISLIPGLNRILLPLMPIAARHHWGKLGLKQQFEWTLLDTFDWYAPRYDTPQKEADVAKSLSQAGMTHISRQETPGLAIVAEKPR